jgi:uncharacterized membrane protein YecN with MAPEG domain
MTELQAVSLYVGANLLILLALGINVIRLRGSTKTSLGHGESAELERACRAHANASEWTPGALVGLVIMALIGAPMLAIHALGMSLTLARALHGWGLSSNSGTSMGRFMGALLTLIVYLGLAIGLIGHAII